MKYTKISASFAAEIEQLIEHNLVRQRAGDKEGFGIKRIIEILRNNTVDNPAILKAKDNEPIFVLRGQDVLAPAIVETWAKDFALNVDKNTQGIGELPPLTKYIGDNEPHQKYLDALECADAMRRYPVRKIPD